MSRPVDALRVRYELRVRAGESARAKAAGIAREQTVEIAPGIAPEALEARTMGRVVRVATVGDGRALATIDYPWRETISDLPQLLNLLFGNVSMQRGIRVAAIEWPAALLQRFPGPRFGVAGVRERLGVSGRPLVGAVLKPLGLSPAELARAAAECALAGIDLVKDDHSLADQPSAPFRERVFRVAEAVRAAERRSGGRTLYFPNLTGPVDRFADRLDDLREAGVEGALVAPMLLGLDTVRALSEASGLVLLAHPSFTGSLFAPAHGLAPELWFGDLLRLAGADLVNFPVAGGRFAFTRRDESAVIERLAAPLGALRPALPMVAGGIDAAKLERLVPRHATDTVYLVGGELFRGGRTAASAARLARLVRTLRPADA